MKLKKLLEILEKSSLDIRIILPASGGGLNGTDIVSLVSDSRKSAPGTIFACVRGDHSDGHDYAAKAVEAGASAIMCEYPLDLAVPQIICPDIRRNMGAVASLLYDSPLSKLTMIAVTGTNGKTTSVFMTKSILEEAGIKTGLLGTVSCDDGNNVEAAEHTTPEGSDLQQWLYRMTANGCGACVMEASSHSIVQGRLEGALYDRAGFTNLTVDHLNYHLDMESYYKAKKTLFENYMRNDWRAAVNIDDGYGARLFDELGPRAVSYSIKDSNAMFFASLKSASVEGMDVEIKMSASNAPRIAKLPLLGEYNMQNALQALSLAWTLGIDAETAISGAMRMKPVPGRLERYTIKGVGSCVIDFAHNPDGLEKALTALRSVCRGKLYVAFGASGESDKSKRPMMGEVATRLADSVIITSDNPRSEDPHAIASEIEAGAMKHPAECRVIVDRRDAVFEGLSRITPDDILVLAGKGPERYQELKGGPVPYNDKETMLEWCRLNGKEVL
jgi:UDP-N-acetylmuramoyl-L-alanyl-D-glutamate--2,6-diaminopimelate ligase